MVALTSGRTNGKKVDISDTELFIADTQAIERKAPTRIIICYIITASVLVSFSTWMIIGHFNGNPNVRLSTVLPEFCCDCRELYDRFSGDIKGREQTRSQRNGNNSLECCARTPDEYTKLMKKMQEKLQNERFAGGNGKKYSKEITFTVLHQSPVAGHVLIDAVESRVQPNNERGRLPIIKLLPERSLSLLKQVTCERDRIIIHSKGVYLVYSQLYMKAIRGTNWPEGWKLLVHVVERYNQYLPNGGEEKLLQSVHTLTESTEHKGTSIDFHTSYTSGVFELEEGDELYVRVNSTDVVSRYPTLNYIGVVRLSNATDSKDI